MHDRLALDLTSLANERNLLAYVRTALAFLAAGAALLSNRLFGTGVFKAIGWTFIGLGIVVVLVGAFRFAHVRRAYRHWWAGTGVTNGPPSISGGVAAQESEVPARSSRPSPEEDHRSA
ncbi:MAG TPA: DUF202 domain-containing protein [Gemmatimonadaceae bacterium]|nr:DUF202 domain-containing protein [Gemmatimonadaceae bacterium]